ncbi:MAG: hypothetical protein IPI49_22735 [Myxococcales bacterium]|nr:hypothetical protein [Myxococcales bacterium]
MKVQSIGLLTLLAAACGGDGAPPCDGSVVGRICTIAGEGKSGYRGDDGPALEAQLSLPQDTLHLGDLLYIIDWNNHRIRKLEPDGTIRHVAGRGELGGTLDDPTNSDLNHPTSLIADPAGRLYVAAWHNSKVLSIDQATGEIQEQCGDGRRAYFGDGGAALTASLDLPASLVFAPSGELLVMDQANQVIRRVDAAGRISRLAGRCVVDAAPPLGAGPCPDGVAPQQCPGQSGKSTCGALSTCSLPCSPAYAGDDGPALDLRMSQPFGQSADPAGRMVVDPAGAVIFADTANAVIRKIDASGLVTRVAGVAPVAGRPQRGFSGDGGPAREAMLNNPVDLALDSDGTLYVSDVYNHCIRAISPEGIITTAVGQCGVSGYGGDDGPAGAARLKRPYGVEVADGVLYVADTGNHVIRAVRLR